MQSSLDEMMRRISYLTQNIGTRMSGSGANLQARQFICLEMESMGLDVEIQEYPCPGWKCEEIALKQADEALECWVNPFSPSCSISSRPVFASTLAELELVAPGEQLVVLFGDLTSQVISCKSWFLIEERDQKILEVLERKNLGAVLTVQNTPGSINRILEDWEVTIPSATIPSETALQLFSRPSEMVSLTIRTSQTPAVTANLVVRIPGKTDEWIAVMAHYDTKIDTPGAIDNGTGIGLMLAMMEEYRDQKLETGLEFIAFAGEEYLPIGDDTYLQLVGESHLEKVKFAINIDGVGHVLGSDSIAPINCSPEFSALVQQNLEGYRGMLLSEPWPESNHSTFTFRGVPAIAFTSHSSRHFVHQMEDSFRWVDPNKLQQVLDLTKEIVDLVQAKPLGWFRSLQQTADESQETHD